MKSDGTLKALKWALCGIIISIVVNAWYVVSLYIDYPTIGYYLVSIPVAMITLLMLNEKTLKGFLLALLTMTLCNIVTELLLYVFKVTDYFYYNVYPDAKDYALGEGLIMVFLYGVSACGVAISSVITLVVHIKNIIRRRNKSK